MEAGLGLEMDMDQGQGKDLRLDQITGTRLTVEGAVIVAGHRPGHRHTRNCPRTYRNADG